MLGRLDGLFLPADEAIIDEIHAVTGERQLPTPIETRLFLNEFLGERFPGCQIPEEAVRRVVSLHLTDGLPAAIEGAVASAGLDPQAMTRFARRLSGGPAGAHPLARGQLSASSGRTSCTCAIPWCGSWSQRSKPGVAASTRRSLWRWRAVRCCRLASMHSRFRWSRCTATEPASSSSRRSSASTASGNGPTLK